eukprot:359266-Chlamydomonas_euryale.AAC.2
MHLPIHKRRPADLITSLVQCQHVQQEVDNLCRGISGYTRCAGNKSLYSITTTCSGVLVSKSRSFCLSSLGAFVVPGMVRNIRGIMRSMCDIVSLP